MRVNKRVNNFLADTLKEIIKDDNELLTMVYYELQNVDSSLKNKFKPVDDFYKELKNLSAFAIFELGQDYSSLDLSSGGYYYYDEYAEEYVQGSIDELMYDHIDEASQVLAFHYLINNNVNEFINMLLDL